MSEALDRSRVRFPGISSRAYEHPADRGALVALRSLRGFDTVLRRMSGLFNERALRLHFLSGAVRVGDTQFADVHQDVADAVRILDVAHVPETYINTDPFPRAMTIGTDRPFLVLSTGLFDLLDVEERRFIIGHEVGHVLSGHAVYRTLLLALTALAQRVAWVPFGYVGIRAIVVALEEWQRKSELSCDRAGLLVSQDPDAATRTLMKLAGGSRVAQMSVQAFREQAREYDAAEDARDSVLKLMSLMGHSHPHAVVRLGDLDAWAGSGEYGRILAGDYARRADDASASVSDEARNAARSYQQAWNRTADPLLSTLRDVAGGVGEAGGKIFEKMSERVRR